MADDDEFNGKFTKCKKNHIYEIALDECPYCSGKRLEDELVKLVDKNPGLVEKLKGMATCYITGPRNL